MPDLSTRELPVVPGEATQLLLRTLHSDVYISNTSARAPFRVIRWFPSKYSAHPQQTVSDGRALQLGFVVAKRRAIDGFHWISVAFLATFEASRECFELDGREHEPKQKI